MAKRPNINTVASGFSSTTTLNNNFTNLRDGFDNTISRDGSTPNTMEADFDMNGNDILNVGEIRFGSGDTISADDLVGPVGPQGERGPAGQAGPGFAAGGTTSDVLVKLDNTDYNTTWTDPTVELTEALTGTTVDLNPHLGTIKTHTLTGTTTYSETFVDGQSVTLMIDSGGGNQVNWPSITWVNNAGQAKTLKSTSGYSVFILWKVAGSLYGAFIGDG